MRYRYIYMLVRTFLSIYEVPTQYYGNWRIVSLSQIYTKWQISGHRIRAHRSFLRVMCIFERRTMTGEYSYPTRSWLSPFEPFFGNTRSTFFPSPFIPKIGRFDGTIPRCRTRKIRITELYFSVELTFQSNRIFHHLIGLLPSWIIVCWSILQHS